MTSWITDRTISSLAGRFVDQGPVACELGQSREGGFEGHFVCAIGRRQRA